MIEPPAQAASPHWGVREMRNSVWRSPCMDCGHSSSQPGTHFLAICCCCCCIPYSTAAGVKRRLASVPQHPMAHPASLEAHRWLRERLHARERSLAAPVGAVPCRQPASGRPQDADPFTRFKPNSGQRRQGRHPQLPLLRRCGWHEETHRILSVLAFESSVAVVLPRTSCRVSSCARGCSVLGCGLRVALGHASSIQMVSYLSIYPLQRCRVFKLA